MYRLPFRARVPILRPQRETRGAADSHERLLARLFGLRPEEVARAVGRLVATRALRADCVVDGWPGRWLVHAGSSTSRSRGGEAVNEGRTSRSRGGEAGNEGRTSRSRGGGGRRGMRGGGRRRRWG